MDSKIKKFKKLQFVAKKERSDEENFLHEQNELMHLLQDYTHDLHQATWAFSRALENLNTLNAQLNRGPVEIEDELFHHCVSQETLNADYATENTRYHTKWQEKLSPAPDRQK